MRHVETMEMRRMMSVTAPDSILLGGPDTGPAGGNEVAMEKVVIVHEGIGRGSTANVSELTVTKSTDYSSTGLFR
jgi:hypothetical protein